MGDKYKLWYPLLKVLPAQSKLLPLRKAIEPVPSADDPTQTDRSNPFPLVWLPQQLVGDMATAMALTDQIAPRKGLLKLPKVVFFSTDLLPDSEFMILGDNSNPCGLSYPDLPDTSYHHYTPDFVDAVAAALPDDILLYFGGLFPGGVFPELAGGSPGFNLFDYIGGDVFAIWVQNRNSYWDGSWNNIDVYKKTGAGPGVPCGTSDYIFASSEEITTANPIDSPQGDDPMSFVEAWQNMAPRMRNFHGVVCAVPIDDAYEGLYVYSEAGGGPGYATYYVNKVASQNDHHFMAAAANVDTLNSATPAGCIGDATWEYQEITDSEDPSYFIEQILDWYQVTSSRG